MTSYCHWTGGTLRSYCYWTCQRYLTRLIILCYFRVWRTRLTSLELLCCGFIHMCLADLSLSKLMIENRRLGNWLWASQRLCPKSHIVPIVHRTTCWDNIKSWTPLSFLCWRYSALRIVQRLWCRCCKAARRELCRWYMSLDGRKRAETQSRQDRNYAYLLEVPYSSTFQLLQYR